MKKPISRKIASLVLKTLAYFQSREFRHFDRKGRACILCYHSISKDNDIFSVKPQEFEKQIKFISRSKNVLPVRKIYNLKKDKSRDCVAITFDDGYEDIYKNVLPILKKYGIKATVFVVGSRNLADRVELGNDKKLLTLDQIRDLTKEGWEIGFHSKAHKDLTKLDEAKLKDEIIDGKKNLEKKLGFKLNYFAYPKGKYSSKIIKVVKQAGFEAAFTINGGPIRIDESCSYKISRVVINRFQNFEEFKTLLSNPGLYSNAFIEAVLRIKDGKLLNLTRF